MRSKCENCCSIGILTGPNTLKKIKEKKPIRHLFPKRPKALSLSLSEILNEKYQTQFWEGNTNSVCLFLFLFGFCEFERAHGSASQQWRPCLPLHTKRGTIFFVLQNEVTSNCLIFFVLIIVSFCVCPWALNFELGLKLLNGKVKFQVLSAWFSRGFFFFFNNFLL